MTSKTILLVYLGLMVLLFLGVYRTTIALRAKELILPNGFYSIKKEGNTGYAWIEVVNGKAFYRGGQSDQ